MHDWFSKTGQGYGGEYRNLTGRRSQAYLRTYFLKEHEAQFTDAPAVTTSRQRARAMSFRATPTRPSAPT